jgi:hypothetical protein
VPGAGFSPDAVPGNPVRNEGALERSATSSGIDQEGPSSTSGTRAMPCQNDKSLEDVKVNGDTATHIYQQQPVQAAKRAE